MSNGDKSHTNVLLPAAQVTLFTRDAETRRTFEAIAQDWRFARVIMDIQEGDADTAVALYERTASPQLVIIQTEDIDNGFSDKLEALSGVCAEGTAAMIIGPVNDVNLYRKLIAMGVSDYIVRPVQQDALSHDIAANLLARIGTSESRLIVTVGAKGGVGVTVLTEALAWGLSDNLGQKTFLLDAAGGWSSLSVGMDFEPAATLADALRAAVEQKEESLGRMMFKAGERLTILSTGGDVMLEDNVTPEHYEYFLDYIMATYPVVLVDLSAASAALKGAVLRRAHEILLVTTPTLPAVRATRTLLQEIRDLRGGSDKNVDVIINMQGITSRHEVPRAQIEEGLERKVSAVIPFDPSLFISTESAAKKLSTDKSGATIVNDLLLLARKVLTLANADSQSGEKAASGLGGILKKIKKGNG